MSVRRDYILRMIEQFGQFWAAVVQLAKEGRHQDALALIDQTRQQTLGLSATTIDSLSADELVGLVGLGYSPRLGTGWMTDRLTMLGLLLRAEANTHAALHDHERSNDRALKALQVCLAALADAPDASPQAAETIDLLAARFAGQAIPPDTADQLWQHFERRGAFARAEDWLFRLLDGDRAPDDLVARGLAFYARLQEKSAAELLQGDLPPDEVAAGLAELRVRGENAAPPPV